jgi:hypothetical protein
MIGRFFALGCLVVLLAAGTTFGQSVQLPTYNYSTVNTTVSVPDGGTAVMGGVKRGAWGQTSRGVPIAGKLPFVGRPFGNRAIGSRQSAGMMSTTVQIIDFQELEEQLMGGRIGRHTGHVDASPLDRRASHLSQNVARQHRVDWLSPEPRPESPAGPSLEEIRRRNVLANQERGEEAVFFFEKAEKAEADGKANVAKIYYRMASTRAEGEFKDMILAKMESLSSENLAARER